MIKHSATLALNERIEARKAQGLPVVHLGFGEAGLPVPSEVTAVLSESAEANSYAPVAGTLEARRAAAGYCSRREIPTDAERVVLAPGSKALLYATLAALPGDLVLPTPSWVSYAAQAQLTGKRVIRVPIPEHAGGIPDPDQLPAALEQARATGSNPQILILTLPDNPTGTQPTPDAVKQVCATAEQYGLTIISDEIYRDLLYEPGAGCSPATICPDRTVVTGGLSKNMALGGWRIGFTRLPEGPLGDELHTAIIGIASELWSSLPAPMQAVAAYVFAEPEPVTRHINASRALHAAISQAVHRIFTDAGATCREPTAAFYCYPDFEPLRPTLQARGITTGTALCEHLLNQGVGVLAGEHFGDVPERYRFRAASSLLYGETTTQRIEALHSTDPVTLPWISEKLTTLHEALTALI